MYKAAQVPGTSWYHTRMQNGLKEFLEGCRTAERKGEDAARPGTALGLTAPADDNEFILRHSLAILQQDATVPQRCSARQDAKAA
ncbi:hypothetical protein ColTof4_14048 [Colletotrichum tofieldiae]|nr:hypothetical protein ColTof3_14683 [Colletotrichum tofieldiae]GKT81625.1 hypothetical protein ColTof4_14048 [Colletotrichum tofieldiae]GKT97600.1 hypothetical protein Ct61P_15450 [Colletotrichum tofieldiae]